jgi:LEA14-like dessication related protein
MFGVPFGVPPSGGPRKAAKFKAAIRTFPIILATLCHSAILRFMPSLIMTARFALPGFNRAASLFLLIPAFLIISGCSTLQNMLAEAPKPTASLKDVSFKSVSFTSVQLQFDLEVNNPYDVPLPLVNLDYTLSAGESKLLKGAADIQSAIPAKQSKVVSLPAEVSILEVINFARGVRSGAKIPYDANANLSVDAPVAGRLSIPVGKKGEIAVPSIPGL